MAKIYNEIVIDMNPQSSSFEKVIYEDSFEYSGDMMLMYGQDNTAGNTDWAKIEGTEVNYIDTTGDGIFDTSLTHEKTSNGQQRIIERSGDYSHVHRSGSDSASFERIKTELNAVPESKGAGFDEKEPILAPGGDDPGLDVSLGQRGIGMEDVTAEDMLGKDENEMLKWIIDTKYGGVLPPNISENDIRSQIRTKLPQKGGITGTDWYGIQDTAGKVAGVGTSVYGGMGTGGRQEIAGQKQIGKDIYALEEKKGEEWTSKFRTFLSGLPSATGT